MTEVETGETSLTIRRTFDASRERVWKAWTDREQVDRWWGPDGFTTTTDEMDVRPGGTWRFVMVGPDGEEYPNLILFDEVEEPERLAYAHGSPDDPDQFRVVVTFDDLENGRTALTMRSEFDTAAERQEKEEFGAIEGAKQTLDKLAHHLPTGEVA